ncbi:MAG: hypothetical protein JNL82_38580 [Myxococcales bacterium]|nr:hypothetical protein [Myxococcales bacterium]
MHEPPAIRAHYSRLALKRLRAYPEGKGAEIRERVSPEHLSLIREAASLSWLPVAAVVELCDAILAVLGEDAANEFWTDLMRDSYDSGLLKPLTVLAHFSLGRSGAARLLQTAPRAWALSTRNCGTIETVESPDTRGGMRLQSVDLVPEVLHSRGFVCVFHGACQAMLELFKSRGKVRVFRHNSDGQVSLAFEIAFDGS